MICERWYHSLSLPLTPISNPPIVELGMSVPLPTSHAILVTVRTGQRVSYLNKQQTWLGIIQCHIPIVSLSNVILLLIAFFHFGLVEDSYDFFTFIVLLQAQYIICGDAQERKYHRELL
mmetsp:Transcript_30973/g.65542  ORF Transcript_30973/g.65542 Transcript_30973/m.65542 type:complete len:119 (-) Transcript_30973:551-907(-)